MRDRRWSLLLTSVVFAAALGAPSRAEANGRSPDSVKLIFRPGQPSHMVLGVTFGVIESTDSGVTWRWACESAVGFSGTYDPDYEITPAGTLLATTFMGLRLTRDRCTWTGVPAPLGETFVSAIGVGPDGAIYAGTSDPATSGIYKSTDDGASFVATGPIGQAGDWWEAIEIAPSDPTRIYVTGFRLAGVLPRQRLLFRSRDAGVSWEELPTTAFLGTNNSDLLIAGVHPTDPERLFIRMTLTGKSLQERFYRTTNAGTTAVGGPAWQQVLEVPDYTQGFAIRANGEVWAGALTQGLFRSIDGGRTFAPVAATPPVNPRCLRERSDGQLYACGNNLPPDSAALTRTLDGSSWAPVFAFAAVAGPFRCDSGTLQREDCEGLLWCGVKDQLGIASTEIDCTDAAEAIDAGIDGGTGADRGGGGCCDAGGGRRVELAAAVLLLVPRRRRRR